MAVDVSSRASCRGPTAPSSRPIQRRSEQMQTGQPPTGVAPVQTQTVIDGSLTFTSLARRRVLRLRQRPVPRLRHQDAEDLHPRTARTRRSEWRVRPPRVTRADGKSGTAWSPGAGRAVRRPGRTRSTGTARSRGPRGRRWPTRADRTNWSAGTRRPGRRRPGDLQRRRQRGRPAGHRQPGRRLHHRRQRPRLLLGLRRSDLARRRGARGTAGTRRSDRPRGTRRPNRPSGTDRPSGTAGSRRQPGNPGRSGSQGRHGRHRGHRDPPERRDPQAPRARPGPPGPTAVSTDANNAAKLGTDSKLWVPKSALPIVTTLPANAGQRQLLLHTSVEPQDDNGPRLGTCAGSTGGLDLAPMRPTSILAMQALWARSGRRRAPTATSKVAFMGVMRRHLYAECRSSAPDTFNLTVEVTCEAEVQLRATWPMTLVADTTAAVFARDLASAPRFPQRPADRAGAAQQEPGDGR